MLADDLEIENFFPILRIHLPLLMSERPIC